MGYGSWWGRSATALGAGRAFGVSEEDELERLRHDAASIEADLETIRARIGELEGRPAD